MEPNYLVLLGIVIVIVGFALRLDAILIIIVAAVVTALVGGIGVDGFLTTLGTSFVSNRSMAVFIIVLLVTGTLERNGLKTAAAQLIGKVRNATPGMVIALYGVMRLVFAAFNVSFGGVAGFVRPVTSRTTSMWKSSRAWLPAWRTSHGSLARCCSWVRPVRCSCSPR